MSAHGGPDSITNGLIGYWDAGNSRSYSGSGNTINDISGFNQSGTLTNGPTYYNGTLNFNKASSQYIDFGDLNNFSFTNNIFTMSFWVKFNSTGVQGVLGKRGSPWEYSVFANPTGTLNFVCWASGGDGVYTTSTTFSANIWYNFTWTADGTNAYLYVNGNWINTIAKSAFSMSNTSQPLRFGAGGNAATGLVYLDGIMSNFSLYNRCLSDYEIIQNYNALRGRFTTPSIVTNGLVLNLDAGVGASYPGTGTTWTDLIGTNNGTLVNGVTYNSGNQGYLVFDGVNDYVNCGSSLLLSRPFSISCWVYFNSLSGYQTVVGQDTSAAVAPAAFYFQKYRDNMGADSNVFGIAITNAAGTIIYCYDTVPVQLGVWYNYCCVLSTNQVLLYRNDTLVRTVNNSDTLATTTGNLLIGAGYYENVIVDFVNSKISQVKIYNRALSAEEIQQNFNATRGRFGI